MSPRSPICRSRNSSFTASSASGASCRSASAPITTAAACRQAAPIPPFLLPLRERAAAFAGLAPDDLVHALITEYRPGAAIGWHRDRPYYGDVIGISLLSPCTFRLRKKRGAESKGSWERASLRLDRRSIYLMRGPSRDEWEHSIPAVDELRYSVTFRSMRSAP